MRPKTTLILLAYRQERFVQQAIASALAQDADDLEIILSDDHSPDGTFELMRRSAEQYSGRHSIRLNRMSRNQGIVAHFNEAVKLASANIVVYLAGDDVSAVERCRLLSKCLEDEPELTFVESRYRTFSGNDQPIEDLAGLPPDGTVARTIFDESDYRSGRAPRLSSSTRAFRKEPFLHYPPLRSDLPSEDSSTALRLLRHGAGAMLDARLLMKREHGSNLTGPSALSRMNFDLILDQYVSDARHALSAGYLSQTEFDDFEAWAVRHMDRRKLRVLFDVATPTTSQLFTTILPSPSLAVREKLYAVRRYVAGMIGRRQS